MSARASRCSVDLARTRCYLEIVVEDSLAVLLPARRCRRLTVLLDKLLRTNRRKLAPDSVVVCVVYSVVLTPVYPVHAYRSVNILAHMTSWRSTIISATQIMINNLDFL